MPVSAHRRPLIYGEVLFDRFPDGTAVLGGAPFNVAWHLAGFGLSPLLVSRVGDDADGEAVLRGMTEWGMDTSGVQRDPSHATGTVRVSLSGGQPSFDIVADRAYDHIEPGAALQAAGRCDAALLYHGTLAARAEQSRSTLLALRATASLPAFVDVNLRPPWTDAARIAPLVRGARWVKLNDAELAELRAAGDDTVSAARALIAGLGAHTVIVTLGADGAQVVTAEEVLRGAPEPVAELVDAVGAGDAFSAVFVAGILNGWPAADTLQRALAFASAICAIRGATTTDRRVYARARDAWARAAPTP